MARRCLIIANQHYRDQGIAELPGAAEDADALSKVLAQSDIGGFEVTVVRDAGVTDIRRNIESFFQQAGLNDVLWLHLSCHGMRNRDGRLILAATDTERNLLASTGIDSTFISDQVESSRCRRVVVFLDCCYSGAYSRGLRTRSADASVDVADAFSGKGRVVITASNALQFSHETVVTSRDAAQPSIFTRTIVTGLATGDADLDLNGQITVDELYEYVHREVREQLPDQTPTLSVSSAEGTIPLARNVRIGLSRLPAELVKTSLSPLGWQRRGVLHELENLLGHRDADVRKDAQDLLAQLIADPDTAVAAQARKLWLGRSLGELNAGSGPEASATRASGTEVTLASTPDHDGQRTGTDHIGISDSADNVGSTPPQTATWGEPARAGAESAASQTAPDQGVIITGGVSAGSGSAPAVTVNIGHADRAGRSAARPASVASSAGGTVGAAQGDMAVSGIGAPLTGSRAAAPGIGRVPAAPGMFQDETRKVAASRRRRRRARPRAVPDLVPELETIGRYTSVVGWRAQKKPIQALARRAWMECVCLSVLGLATYLFWPTPDAPASSALQLMVSSESLDPGKGLPIGSSVTLAPDSAYAQPHLGLVVSGPVSTPASTASMQAKAILSGVVSADATRAGCTRTALTVTVNPQTPGITATVIVTSPSDRIPLSDNHIVVHRNDLISLDASGQTADGAVCKGFALKITDLHTVDD